MRKWFVGKLVDIVPLGIGGHYPGEDIKFIKFKREYQLVWNWDVFYDVRISISMTITMWVCGYLRPRFHITPFVSALPIN